MVVVAPFEEANLEPSAFDLAIAATSFHWVAQPAGWGNLIRALRPGGRAIIWWMLFEDPTALDEFDFASQKILGGSPSLGEPNRPLPFQMDVDSRTSDLVGAGFVDVQGRFVRKTYRLSAEQVTNLHSTMAIVLRKPEPEQATVLNEIMQLVLDRFGGQVERTFLTAIYQGRKPL
jgi:SAM-dependent methyltransferase